MQFAGNQDCPEHLKDATIVASFRQIAISRKLFLIELGKDCQKKYF